MKKNTANINLPKMLRVVGIIGVVLGLTTVLWSLCLYSSANQFSFFETYLSDMGNKTGWPQVVFNSGMLLSAPVRYLFLALLVMRLMNFGASRSFALAALITGAFVVIGSIGVSAIPYSLNLKMHMSSALIYFFGVVILQTIIAVQEWRIKQPWILPVASIFVVAIYLIFASLMSMAGKVEGITRSTPVIWEWLAFCSLMLWLITHTVILGRQQK